MQRPPRVLVADDEATLRFLFRLWLEGDGYDVRAVEDGAHAVVLLESEPLPDCAVLDIAMPRLDGLEVCRRLRALSETLPIVVVSALDELAPEAFEAGATAFLPKPLLADDLRRTVRALVGAPRRCAA
jgi:two-component system response regulator MprA